LSATRTTLRGEAKTHKPADSGGVVVRCARRCSHLVIPHAGRYRLSGLSKLTGVSSRGFVIHWDCQSLRDVSRPSAFFSGRLIIEEVLHEYR
jgi:hypothetical protein